MPENVSQSDAPALKKWKKKGPSLMPKWEVKEDIVISGFSGRFPESNHVEELKKNLFEGIDMITENDRRWKPGIMGTSRSSGKLKDITYFDSMFFGVHGKMADAMDPQQRLLVEATYEAIFDAGYDPASLRGKKIGVFIGCSDQCNYDSYRTDRKASGYELLGMNLGMMANRISYTFDFKGPSFTLDADYSASFHALNEAVLALRTNRCEAAIVGGSKISVNPIIAQTFSQLGLMSEIGECRVFDAKADGSVRSEGVGIFMLQRKSQARRCYATILHCKLNNDGAKPEGLTSPGSDGQKQLYRDVYSELDINPAEIQYLEAHGTGTVAGDREEANGIADFFLSERKTPLLIGSVKSNLGFAEAASGMESLAKVILSMEESAIPPNLHYTEPNPQVPALLDGQLQVVTEVTPFNPDLVAINNFGLGGSNGHAVLRCNPREATKQGKRPLPRLALACGRTEDAVKYIFKKVEEEMYSDEAIALLEEASKAPTSGMCYRGYALLGDAGQDVLATVEKSPTERRPVWFLFSGMGSQWPEMAKKMMKLDVFAESIRFSAQVLKPYGVDLVHLLTEATEDELDNVIAPFVTIASVQVALVDMVKALGIEPDGIVGHSVGELGCAYADGCLTAEQMIKAAYWRGKSCADADLIQGSMAAIGLSWEETKKRCPEEMFPVCHNADDSVTVSGPADVVKKFVEELNAQKVFARTVKTCGIAFHSKYVEPASHQMRKELEKVIPNALPRSARWVSSSVPESRWDEPQAQLSSVDYHVNNLLSPVLFNEAMTKVPKNAMIIEFAPHSFLQAIVKRILGPESIYIGLMKRGHQDNTNFFLEAIGKMYTSNLNPCASRLYPPVEFPVPRGTPMFNSLIKWEHNTAWSVNDFASVHNNRGIYITEAMKGSSDEYFTDHKVDGRVLYPAMGYIHLVWEVLSYQFLKNPQEQAIVLEDVNFWRATILPKNYIYRLGVNILYKNGQFQIMDGESVVVTGTARFEDGEVLKVDEKFMRGPPSPEGTFNLNASDFYKELRLGGYEYGPHFQGVMEAASNGLSGILKWDGRWITFMDSMLQVPILAVPKRALLLPIRFKSIRIDPRKMPEKADEGIPFTMNPRINVLKAGPVEIQGLRGGLAPRLKEFKNEPVLEEQVFVPFFDYCTLTDKEKEELEEYVHVCSTLAHKILDKDQEDNNNTCLAMNGCKEVPEKLIEKYWQGKDKSHVFLKVLKEILDPSCAESSTMEREKKEADVEEVRLQVIDSENKPEKIENQNNHYVSSENNLGLKKNVPISELYLTSGEEAIVKNSKNSSYEQIEPISLRQNVKNIMNKYTAEMNNDTLIKSSIKETSLRAALDIVQDNFHSMKLKILEVSAEYVFHNDVVRMLSMTTLGIVRFDYTVARLTLEEIPEGLLPSGVKAVQMESGSSFPGGNDLIVSKDLFTDSNRPIVKTLNDLIAAVKPSGFVLLVERTHITPVEKFFSLYTEKLKQEQNEENLEKAFEAVGLLVVAKKKDQVISVTYLLRKSADENDEEPHVIFIPEADDHDWVNKLKDLLIDCHDTMDSRISENWKNSDDLTDKENQILAENTESGGIIRSQKNSLVPVSKVNNDKPKTVDSRKIWLVAQHANCGILGLFNCLKNESEGKQVRLYFDATSNGGRPAPKFELSNKQIQVMLRNDLAVNIYQNGQWGKMSHRLLHSEPELQNRAHSFLNVTNRGDLTSIKWIESPLKHFHYLSHELPTCLVQVYYAPLNFRDIMLASGRLPPDAIPGAIALQECILGLEFSGKDENGRRVMGVKTAQALANTVSSLEQMLLEVPEDWTLEEASTVPVVYLTAYYALVSRGKMKEGESVLIHSASGGVGQAAISIALDMKCQVFLTVGSEEKKAYLKDRFPQLEDTHFSNSREDQFEFDILNATDGEGVDLVLNSLAEDKLQASVRCLKENGRFLEIGKYDIAVNNKLGMSAFQKNITFHGVLLDSLYDDSVVGSIQQLKVCLKALKEGIRTGAVKPLKANVFNRDQGEEAFRFMASGKHIGKVVIKIRDEEPDRFALPVPLEIPSVPRTYCHPKRSYIVTGGLGGFGFELVNWLVDKGAKHILVSSRTGLKSGYQQIWYDRWKTEGVMVKVSAKDITSDEGAKGLLEEARKMAPVDGIFHLAMVLHDGMFGKLKKEDFDEVWNPKAKAANFLDLHSRKLCPDLKYFVVFSSIACGRGNPGQSNYGYANSAMERLVEIRRHQGLHGLAIQWGGIGDVGVVYEHMGGNEVLLKGSIPQRLNSCLTTLDRLLQEDHAIVSSFVPSEKAAFGLYSEKDLIEMLCNVLGIKDPSTVKEEMTLGELGMDSLMGVEIKQVLETDYDTVLTVPEVRGLSIQDLRVIGDKKKENLMTQDNDSLENTTPSLKTDLVIPTEVLVPLNDVKGNNCVFFVHPVDRHTGMLKDVAARLHKPAYGLQFTEEVPHKSVQEIASYYVQHVKKVQPHGPYHLVGYSYGSLVAFEMALLLQGTDQVRSYISIDSSPAIISNSAKHWLASGIDGRRLAQAPFELVMKTYFTNISKEFELTVKREVMNTVFPNEKNVEIFIALLGITVPKQTVETMLDHSTRIALATKDYEPSGLFRGKATLIKATLDENAQEVPNVLEHDYGMKNYVNGSVEVLEMKCFHWQIIAEKAEATAIIINSRTQD